MIIFASAMTGLALAASVSADVARGPGPRHGPVAIVATFDRSEWTQAGRVSLELVTGRYALTPQPGRRQQRAGIRVRVRHGRLAALQLTPIREAAEVARVEGLVDPACRAGQPPPRIVLSNAGPIMMRLEGPNGATTPDARGCWSRAALRLYDALEEAFGPLVYPGER